MGTRSKLAKAEYVVEKVDPHGEWEVRVFKKVAADLQGGTFNDIRQIVITDNDLRARIAYVMEGHPLSAYVAQKAAPVDIHEDQLLAVLDTFLDERDDEEGRQWGNYTSLSTLIDYLVGQRKDDTEAFRTIIDSGYCSFENLRKIMRPKSEIVVGEGAEALGGTIKALRYKTTWMGARYFDITYQAVRSGRNGVVLTDDHAYIPEFEGIQKIAALNVRPISAEEKTRLAERGKLFRKVTGGPSYMQYDGTLLRQSWWSSTEFRAAGRVMVDLPTMVRIDPDYFNSGRTRLLGSDERDQSPGAQFQIKDDDLWRCDTKVYGFSFTAKRWGEMSVAHMSDIVFRDEAFETLVLDATVKRQILALVKNAASTFTDIISGKGGGSIFLLAGPPGVGKTLTAEAVSEVLRRPLYSVSVGELGTGPEALEERLRIILDVARSWNAVVLLDEADIFLAKRDEHDILRNAMVGVFLRLLEYHQGVLFLTTNRASDIDPAFNSRISLALHYAKLGDESRQKVWENLLKAAGVEGIDVHLMGRYEINGRQIKNTIRLAQALAREENSPVQQDHLEQVLRVAERFERDGKE
ncbi:MAG: AAA family ATPase [Patescibacteria group bacterium]|nr:AAA family ATPase [Patescibacteria group bacterium]